jgi:hypothetical protein
MVEKVKDIVDKAKE